jgi:hypothetical protein
LFNSDVLMCLISDRGGSGVQVGVGVGAEAEAGLEQGLESGVVVLRSLLLPETDLEDHQAIHDHGAE